MRRRPSLAALAVALALALGVIGAAPSPASAWSTGACPGSAGVTVVVDFTALGGDVAGALRAGTAPNRVSTRSVRPASR